ncbi:MAG: type II toxin-antitoxin system VapC family toxin [Planctomycetes bacterium]|nr:type II toxin-antitoxin system VapC family toxin [Planctomycetota bacterium]
MTTYALDTDTATLLLRGHAKVCVHAARVEPEQLSVTIVTVEEVLTGWYSQIRRAKKDEQVLRAYAALQQAIEFLGRIRVLPMDLDAWRRFQQFRKGKHHIGTNDLKMAAIAQRHGSTLVTRNLRDFRRIPSLVLEDWS